MSTDAMRALQLERLKKIVRYAYDNVPFYKKKYDEAGVSPDDIVTLDDIRKLPFTVKSDLRDNYPYGLLAVPKTKLKRIHASSGTSGKPTVVCYTDKDMEIWSDCCARLAAAAGVNGDDIVQVSFGYGLFTGALGMHQGCEKLGAAIIPASSGNTERQVMLLKDLEATVLVCTPSYALYIGEMMEKLGYKPEDFKLRIGLFGSEASTEEMHREIANKLHIFTNDNYGLSELIGPGVSGECTEKCGMHINEDHFYPELLDPETFEPVPDGQYGELVLTSLTKEGMPVIRYRTKDITAFDHSPCKSQALFCMPGPKQGFHDSACHACVPCPSQSRPTVLRACSGKQAPCEGSQGHALHLPQHALRLTREVSRVCSPAPLPQKPCSLQPAIHHQRQGTGPGRDSGDGNGPVTPTHLEYRQYVSERDRERAAAAGDCDQ